MSKFTVSEYASTKEILKFPDHYVALAVMVDDTNVVAGADGRKIVPKGTIVGGVTDPILLNDQERVEDKVVPGSPISVDGAEGVLLNDIDVTHGAKEGAMLIHGFISIDKLPYGDDNEEVATLVGDLLPAIKFIK